jgi:hypothetical protein
MTSLAEPPVIEQSKCQRCKEITRPFTYKANEAKAPSIVRVFKPLVCNVWGATAGVAEYSGGSYAENLQQLYFLK